MYSVRNPKRKDEQTFILGFLPFPRRVFENMIGK